MLKPGFEPTLFNSGVRFYTPDTVGSIWYFLSPRGEHTEEAHKHSSVQQRKEGLQQNLLVSLPKPF